MRWPVDPNKPATGRIRRGEPGRGEAASRNQFHRLRVWARQNVLLGEEMQMSIQTLSPSRATCGRRAISSARVISPFR